MTNAELISKIKAEIERLKKEELTRNSIGVITGSAFFVSANELLSFLDTLQESSTKTSPFTGGKVILESREEEITFRGEKIKIDRKFYRCKDTDEKFTDAELDNDMMWNVFRKYCEKKGFENFDELLPRDNQQEPDVDL